MTIIEECASTNSAIERTAPHGFALMARRQTAGRGQRGNSWEAAPGLNITLSLMLRPHELPAARQFEVSEAVALGITDLLLEQGLTEVKVKWPNDIYVGDRKICGILIENSLSGNLIGHSIAGIGLNVNQTEFLSDAPNPVSLKQLTGKDYALEPLAERMCTLILNRLGRDNHADYKERLWRGVGEWPWRTVSGELITAAIDDVLLTGHLVVADKPYAYKEIFPVMTT